MAIGTNDIKEALWSQLEKLNKADFEKKSTLDREMILKQSNEVLKVTAQLTDVLKVELHAMEIMTKQDGVKLGMTAAKHFGVIDKE